MNTSIPDLQKKAYAYLRDAIIESLKNGELSIEDSNASSKKILRNIDSLESFTELLLFLKSLSDKYPAYKKAYILFKQEETQSKDQQKLEALQQKLKQFASLQN